jgi:hypothetical protein
LAAAPTAAPTQPATAPAPATTTTAAPAPATTTTVTPATTTPPQPVEVTNWPAPQPGASQVITLPSGLVVRVDYTATFGDLFIGAALVLAVVVMIGSRLYDRIRGVL